MPTSIICLVFKGTCFPYLESTMKQDTERRCPTVIRGVVIFVGRLNLDGRHGGLGGTGGWSGGGDLSRGGGGGGREWQH